MAKDDYIRSPLWMTIHRRLFCSPPKENNMYNGWTESQEAIEARKRRILAGYRPARKRTPAKAGGLAKSTAKPQVK